MPNSRFQVNTIVPNPEVKWRKYYHRQTSSEFNSLVPFSNFARVKRGIATGANEFFTFRPSKAAKLSIDEHFLLPCICHAADVSGNIFSPEDFTHLKMTDKQVFVLDANNSSDPNVLSYLAKGVRENIHKRHLTSKRTPWYSIENKQPAPIWVGVFNRSGLRFIRNYTNSINLTTFHSVFPHPPSVSGISIDLLFAYLLTDTARTIFNDNCREYGNGLQKFEPNDLNHSNVLDLRLLPQNIKRTIESLYADYAHCHDCKIINKIDTILLHHFR